MDAAGLHPSHFFQFGDNWPEGVTVDQFSCGALAWITNWLLFGKRAAGWGPPENENANNGRADPAAS